MIVWLVVTAAWGWTQIPNSSCTVGYVRPTNNSSMTWYLYDGDGDWSSTMESLIQDAADQWDAGPGERNRGANWHFTYGGPSLYPQNMTDGISNVSDVSRDTLVNVYNGSTNAIAATIPAYSFPSCIMSSFEIMAIDTGSDYETWEWTTSLPSLAGSGYKSLPTAMLHEFGHGLSLYHHNSLSSLEAHFASELGSRVRINEDDYVGLVALKPDSSTGKNFMLGKWISPSPNDSNQDEIWWNSSTWEVRAGQSLLLADGPEPIAIVVNGTSSYTGVPVYWTISTDQICFDGDDIVIGTRSPGLVSNTPYIQGPDGGDYDIPIGTPTGNYSVCAVIDPYGTQGETDTLDNIIISDGYLEVIP